MPQPKHETVSSDLDFAAVHRRLDAEARQRLKAADRLQHQLLSFRGPHDRFPKRVLRPCLDGGHQTEHIVFREAVRDIEVR